MRRPDAAAWTTLRLPHRVVVFALTRQGAGIHALLVERAAHQGGGWGGIAGAVESGDTLAGAATRAVGHAAGITLDRPPHPIPGYLHRIPIADWDRPHYPPGTKLLNEYAFWALLPAADAPRLDPARYTRAEWLPLQQALGRVSLAMHTRALRLAASALAMVWPSLRGVGGQDAAGEVEQGRAEGRL